MCRIIAQIELSTDSTDIQCRRGLGPCRNSSHVDHVVVLLVYISSRVIQIHPIVQDGQLAFHLVMLIPILLHLSVFELYIEVQIILISYGTVRHYPLSCHP